MVNLNSLTTNLPAGGEGKREEGRGRREEGGRRREGGEGREEEGGRRATWNNVEGDMVVL